MNSQKRIILSGFIKKSLFNEKERKKFRKKKFKNQFFV